MTFDEITRAILAAPDFCVDISDAVLGSTHASASAAIRKMAQLRADGKNPRQDFDAVIAKRFMAEALEEIQAGRTLPPKELFNLIKCK